MPIYLGCCLLIRIVGGLMNEHEKLDYAFKELEAIYEDLEVNIKRQVLAQEFLKKLLDVLKDPEASFVLTR